MPLLEKNKKLRVQLPQVWRIAKQTKKSISFPEPMCLLVSTKTWKSAIVIIPELCVLVLIKRHMGSGNEIDNKFNM